MDFSQGHLPSCQTLAVIESMWLNPEGRKLLNGMVTTAGDGYEVRFPKQAQRPVRVKEREFAQADQDEGDRTFAHRAIKQLSKEFDGENYLWSVYPDRPFHVSGDEVMRVLEIAYARYQKMVHPERFPDIPQEQILLLYRHRNFHYQADESLRDFSGLEVDTLFANVSPEDSSASFNQGANSDNTELLKRVHTQLQHLAQRPHAFIATACTIGTSCIRTLLDPGGKLRPWHDHVIAGVDAENQTIHLIDPFNSRITMILRYDDFLKYFYLIVSAEVSSS